MKAPPSPHVARPVMYHHWSTMTFLHWRYPAAQVQALLPDSLTVETFDGTAWVGLTPFLMEGVRMPGLPVMPWLSRFPETNLRTYARDDHGRSGIWFLSLDAGRLAAVLGGRAGYGLPYFWSDMTVDADDALVRYRCRRQWPEPSGVRCDVDVEPSTEPIEEEELAHFLTARFRLFTLIADRVAAAEVEHPPWPLRRARLLRLDQNLVEAGGLPAPDHDPVLHASPGVPVRVGMWGW
ncbi:YqjF family protein [Nonomuraea sp. NPDC059194]|uniref:YqjF family protein n=1 Tax=Nonomuraea sp. NPDC059194 TaxID=3346764 RepID=UPI003697C6CC